MSFKKLLPTLALSDAGGTAWTNITNIKLEDGQYAESDISKNGVSQWCRGYGYNFNIPSNAIINGITVTVRVYSQNSGNITDTQVYLQDTARNQKGLNYAKNIGISDVGFVDMVYGGPTDLWGATWLVDDINHSNFGVMIEYANSSSFSRWVRADVVWIQVDYEIGDNTYMLQTGAF